MGSAYIYDLKNECFSTIFTYSRLPSLAILLNSASFGRATRIVCRGLARVGERCAVTQSLRCLRKRGGRGEGACLGGVAFPCCLRTVGEAGVGGGRGEAEACAGGVAFHPSPTLTDVEGAEQDRRRRACPGRGTSFPEGGVDGGERPEGGGACQRRGLQTRLRPWSPAVSSPAP